MARELNGTSQYITYTTTTAQRAITTVSFSWWEYLDSNGQYRRPFHIDSTTHDWRMEFDDGWGYVFVAGRATTDGKWSITKPSTGGWHHIAVTYDGSSTSNDPIIYLNGVSQTVTERATPNGAIQLPTGTMWIGADSGSSQFFDGRLSQFAMYNKILSQAEVTALASTTSPLTHYDNGLLLLFDFEADVIEYVSGVSATNTGTTNVADPVTFTYPDKPLFAHAGAEAADSTIGTITPAWPTHQVGDIAIALVESAGGQAVSLNTANGFVELPDSPQATGATSAGTRIHAYWCRATSTSMSSPVFNVGANHGYGVILTVRGGLQAGNPYDVTAGAVKAGADTSASAPTDTTTVNNALVINAISRDNDAAGAAFSAWANANLASITERFDGGTALGNGGGIGVAMGTKATAGSIGSTTATVTSSINASLTITIKPINYPPTVALNSPADASSGSDTTPTLDFTGTDLNGDGVRYNVQVDTVSTFDSQNGYEGVNGTSISDDNLHGSTYYRRGQSFNADGSKLMNCQFKLTKVGSPTGSIFAYLYAHTGTFGTNGVPTGSPLATSDAVDISNVPGSETMVSFYFSDVNQYTTVNGTKYFIVVENSSADSSNYVRVGHLAGAAHSGNGCRYSGSWVVAGGTPVNDVIFSINKAPILDKISGTDSGFTAYTLDQTQGFSNNYITIGGTDETRLAQSFTPSVTKLLKEIRAYTKKVGTPIGTIRMSIYSDNSNSPGTLLAANDEDILVADVNSNNYTTFSFSDAELSLTASTKYWYVLEAISDSNNATNSVDAGIYLVASDPYAGGTSEYSDNGGSWTDIASAVGFAHADLDFREYYGNDTDPFTSGLKADYTIQAGDALSAGTYYWRVRGIDPSGLNTYGAWSSSRSFEITASGSAYTKTFADDVLIITEPTFLRAFTRLHTENLTITDTIIKSTHKTFAETLTITDVIDYVQSRFQTFSETINITDTILRAFTRVHNETITITDNFIKAYNRFVSYAETITVTDSIAVVTQFLKSLEETITMTDTFSAIQNRFKSFVESLTITDMIARAFTRTISETVSITDTLTKLQARFVAYAESVTITDTLSRIQARFKAFSETINITDTIVRAFTRALSDLATVTDTFIKLQSRFKSFSESITTTDTLANIRNKFFSFSDTLTITDSILRSINRTFSETLTITENFAKTYAAAGLEFLEDIIVTDSIRKANTRIFAEAITISETFAKARTKAWSEALTITDTILRAFTRVYSESVTITDTLSRAFTKVKSETITITDTFVKTFLLYLSFLETLTITDTVVKIFILLREFTDTITIKDWMWHMKKKITNLFIKQNSNTGLWTKKESNNGDWETKGDESTDSGWS